MKKEKNTVSIKLLLFSLITLVAIGGASYGLFVTKGTQTGTDTITSGCFSTSFTDGNSINMTNAVPTSDTNGLSSTPYTFTITNTCTVKASYTIQLSSLADSFNDSNIKVSVDGLTAKLLTGYTATTENLESEYSHSYILATGTLAQNASTTYNVRIWLDESTTYDDVSGSSWQGQIKIVNVATT